VKRDDVRRELEQTYGALRSVADLAAVIHIWRQRIPGVTSLSAEVGSRDHVRGDPTAPVVVVELALRAAQAVEAAAAQGRFWELHDFLMRHEVVTDDDHQEHVLIDPPETEIELERAAHRAGLDVERFRADIDDPASLERILGDFRSGLASGVNGTPTFYVGGQRADVTNVDELYTQIARLVTG
jgi:protein-disulfide isomerase